MKPAIFLLFAIILVGCKKSAIDPNEGLSEEQILVSDFIKEFADGAGSATFKEKFTTAPSAGEMKKYGNLYFSAKEITVAGNSATVIVEISKPGEQDPYTEKTWKLSKSGETWKIDSAPVE